MFNEKNGYYNNLEDYRTAETELHTELMAVSRKYINKLGIVSLMGVLDIVKQEIRELEKATNKNLDTERASQFQQPTHEPEPPQTNTEKPGFF